jgi:hypothetical protein
VSPTVLDNGIRSPRRLLGSVVRRTEGPRLGRAIQGRCFDVGAEAEDAFNAYIKASNIWDKCFDDIDCSTDSIEGKLQNQWAKATLFLETASATLDSLG